MMNSVWNSMRRGREASERSVPQPKMQLPAVEKVIERTLDPANRKAFVDTSRWCGADGAASTCTSNPEVILTIYRCLGAEPGAAAADIQSRYDSAKMTLEAALGRRKPDSLRNRAIGALSVLNSAHELLSRPEVRTVYEDVLHKCAETRRLWVPDASERELQAAILDAKNRLAGHGSKRTGADAKQRPSEKGSKCRPHGLGRTIETLAAWIAVSGNILLAYGLNKEVVDRFLRQNRSAVWVVSKVEAAKAWADGLEFFSEGGPKK